MALVPVAAADLQLLTQRHTRGVSKGDLVQLPGGRVGVVQRIDARSRTVYARRLPQTLAGVDKAIRAFKAFSGHEPDALITAPVQKIEGPLWMLGELDGVIYVTVRDGRREKYLHKFRKNDRPALAVSFDGQQLVVLGGGYQVTDRGIEG